MSNSSPPASNTVSPKTNRAAGKFAAIVRWLHIYVSLLGFATLTFFAVTGITLNHPAWFGLHAERVFEHQGEIRTEWLRRPLPHGGTSLPMSDSGEVDHGLQVAKLEVVEHLRASHRISGALSEFRVDERECVIMFKGPGYSADVTVDRETGKYQLTEVALGFVAVINDLHKGRDTGSAWSFVIDVSALLTIFVSITGTILIFYIKRRRWSGIITAVVGTILLVAVYAVFVP